VDPTKNAAVTAAGRVAIDSVRPEAGSVAEVLGSQLGWLGLVPRPGERWAIKLNLTYPKYIPGVVNSPLFVEGLCRWARDHGLRLDFVEGDGGNGSYSADDTFRANGVTALAGQYGMTTTSLSEKPWEWRTTDVGGRAVRLPYSPYFRRAEFDRFVTTPLFKNHVFTVATLGMKNLWGCIPDAYRMYYHHLLDPGIVALYKELRPHFSIFDGLVALRGRGPMDGQPLAMNALMCSDGVGAGEAAALHVMGLERRQVRHLELAHREGLVPDAPSLQWRTAPTAFVRHDFVVERSALNRASIWLGNHPRLQRLVYHSRLSAGIYKVVDLFRRDSAQARLVQGKREGHYTSVPFDR
jgi:uncharacterized protein (DUF362 family)